MLTHFVTESVRDTLRANLRKGGSSDRRYNDDTHLEAALTFLLRSISEAGGRASAKAYQIGKGWLPPYRETTGYIVPTLLDLSERFNRPELAATAERMGDWLSEVQEQNGGFMERDLRQDTQPIVFNTGQILHGFNALIMRRDRKDLIANARRAGEFMVASADENGSFVRHEHFSMPHAYNVRSAWALMTTGRLLGETKFEEVALKNADWTVNQQTETGFFLNNGFQPGRNANSHGIAYVMQGLLEMYHVSGRQAYLTAVSRTAERLLEIYNTDGRVVAEFDEKWNPLATHVCLTGCAQTAIVFFGLYGLGKDKRYLDAGIGLLDDVASTQDVESRGASHFGGIKGSLPIYGRYAPLQYPNWATKFFADALLAKRKALSGNIGREPGSLFAN